MNNRYFSLDTFRGATVALMILVNNPGSWSYIFPPFEHAKWHGCTPTDLVFPFFLFAVGNAMAFVIPRFKKEGDVFFWKKILKRTILIFLIGLFLNWSPFLMYNNDNLVIKGWTWINAKGSLSGIRILGVLQRIAICYFTASIIVYYFKNVTAIFISVIILVSYWILCLLLGNAGDPFSLSGFFGTAIDLKIFRATHIYGGEGVPFDPEGLMSSIAAVVQVMLGYFIGKFIQDKGKNYEMLCNLILIGIGFVFVGYMWDMLFPINKKIWTSSYTIYTTGLAIITLSVMIYFIEFKGSKGIWTKFFDVFGKNALFIFVLSGFLPRVLALIRINNSTNATTGKQVFISPLNWFYEHICKNISTDLRVGSLIYALIMILFYWLIVFILDKKKIYIKV